MYYLLVALGSLSQYEAVSGYVIEASNDSASLLRNIEKRQSIVTVTPVSTVVVPGTVTQTPPSTRSSSRTSITSSSSSTLSSSVTRTTSTSSRRFSDFDQGSSNRDTTLPLFTASNTPIKTPSIDLPKSTTVNFFPQSTGSANRTTSSPDPTKITAGTIGGVAAFVTLLFLFLINRKAIVQKFRNGNFKRKMVKFFKPTESKAGRARSTSWWSRIPLPKFGTNELSAGRQYTTTELPASNVQPVYELHAGSIHRGIEYSGVPEREYQRVEIPSREFVAGELKLLNGNVTPRNFTDVEAASTAEKSERNQQEENLAENHGKIARSTNETSRMLEPRTKEPWSNQTYQSPPENEISVTNQKPIPITSKPKRRETLPPPPLPPRPTKRKKVPDADFRLTSPKGSTTLLTLDLPTSPINLSTPLIPSPIEPPENPSGPKRPPPIVPPRPARFRKKEVVVKEENISEITAFPAPTPTKEAKPESPVPVSSRVETLNIEETVESSSPKEEEKPKSPPQSPQEETSSPTREPPDIPPTIEPEEEPAPIFSSNFSFSSPAFTDPNISTQHVSMPPPSREAPISPTTTHPTSNKDTDTSSLNILLSLTHPPTHRHYGRNKPILSETETSPDTTARKVPHTSPPLSPSQLSNFVPLVPYTPPHGQPLNQNPPPLPLPSVSTTFPKSTQPSRNTMQPQLSSPPLIAQSSANENSVAGERPRASSPLSPRELARLAGAFAPVSYSPGGEKGDGVGVGRWVYR